MTLFNEDKLKPGAASRERGDGSSHKLVVRSSAYWREKKAVVARWWARIRGKEFRAKYSYAQSGEDIIVDYLFMWLGKRKITYLDVGANDPIMMNNTYFFYKRKHRGVLIEPNPRLVRKIKRSRPRDVTIHAGVGMGSGGQIPFFQMDPDTLSTSDPLKLSEYLRLGIKLKREYQVPLIGINEVIERYFDSQAPDFLSIDVEGWDLEILKTLDLLKYRPVVICVETITYSNRNTEQKVQDFAQYLSLHDYFSYADTYLNTIFVDKRVWDARQRN